jgi:phosphatidylglycerophosphate synthase
MEMKTDRTVRHRGQGIPAQSGFQERSIHNGTVPGMKSTGSGPIPPRAVPARALQRDALRYLLVAGAGVLLASWALADTGALGPAYAAKSMAMLGLCGVWIWHSLSAGTAHPHARFGPANGVTLFRLAMVLLMAALVGEAFPRPPLEQAPVAAWTLIVVATLTALLDAVDGHLARRSGLSSAWGARFDMETDAFYILVLCALVVQTGQVGPWILASGLMRYAFVGAAQLWPWLGGPLAPSRRRQTVCVAQVTALIVCLGPIISPGLATAIAACSLVLLSASFAIDIRALALQRAVFKEP